MESKHVQQARAVLNRVEGMGDARAWMLAATSIFTMLQELDALKVKPTKPKATKHNPRFSYGEACALYRVVPKWFGRKNAAGVIVSPKRAVFEEPRCVLVRFADGVETITSTYFRAAPGSDKADVNAIVRAERGSRMRKECERRKIKPTEILMADGGTKRLWLCKIPDVVLAREVPHPSASIGKVIMLAPAGTVYAPSVEPMQVVMDLAA